MITRLSRFGIALVVAGFPFLAGAQIIPPSEQPGRERERFIEPQAPRARPAGPTVTLPSTVAPAGAEKIRLRVRAVRIVGSTVYSAGELAPLYADLVGRDVSLAAIYDLARRITAKYGGDGYVLSRAIVPPQPLDPKGAVVRIEVIEGYVDQVVWPPKLKRYRDFFSSYAAKITAERPANIRTIERYLLLAGDLPGLKFSTTLRPSSRNAKASTLVVEVAEKPLDVMARADNRGTPARGPFEFLTSATANNILGQHEAFTFTYAGVLPWKELHYLGAAYRQVLTSEGLTAFVNGSYGWGAPGTPALEILNYQTRSTVVETGLSYPVIRARERNLTLSGLAFLSDSFSDVLATPFNRDRLRGIRLKADADFADRFAGINQFNVTYSEGFEGWGSSRNGDPFASRPGGRVDFEKIEAYASRLQPLVANFSALLAAYGQYAFVPLLVPEECSFGGRIFGRAFDPSQLLGDHCVEASFELRYDLPVSNWLSLAQFYGFTDYGRLYILNAAVGAPASIHGGSVGAGLRLGWWNHVTADLSLAQAVDGPRRDRRFFFIVTARN